MQDIYFFNTETKKKQPFTTGEPGKASLYTCGPTVYNFAHIGNFRTYVFEDLLRRTLKYIGYQVEQVMNLTDVDDKTIRGALEAGVSLDEYTARYKEAFFSDLKTLSIETLEHYPAATDFIEDMIGMIQTLIEKGVAYQGADGSVYYAIKKFPSYGRLSGLKLDELQAGASERVAADEYDKEHVSDFVLWKGHDPERDGDIFWESPFGPGRPGWHIECSAMARAKLGDTLDLHVGGVDNIFPHHDNEIAQSEACTGSCFARQWMHAEHLIVDGKKMSKSLGNFYTLRDLLEKGYTGREVRYLLLGTHYRTQLNFTLEALEAARSSLQRLDEFAYRLHQVESAGGASIQEAVEGAEQAFATALADDLNISKALAVLFDLLRDMNGHIDSGKATQGDAELLLQLLERFNTVLSVLELEPKEEEVPKEVLDLLQKREAARNERNWSEADAARDEIHALGYRIDDTPQGARVVKK